MTPTDDLRSSPRLWQLFDALVIRPAALELAAITLLWLVYLSLFLPLRPELVVSSKEHERLSGVILAAEVGLKNYDHLPTWNPYIGTGEPLLNNAFNYLFNPFYSLPMLLFGGFAGSKIAIGLGLLIAGYSMWTLTRAVGFGGVARVAAGALYMTSGGIAGKFYSTYGHFQLGLSLAWVPLVLAGLWWTLHSRDRRAPVLMAAAFALLFFAGNIYYTLHTAVSCAVITAFHLIEREVESGRWRLSTDRLRRVTIGGGFALGLAALQFLPIWTVRESVIHPEDPALENRYSMEQAVANLITPFQDWFRYELEPYGLFVAVDYAYISPIAPMLIGAAALALLITRPRWRRSLRVNARAAWVAVTLAVLMMIWGAGQSGVLQYLYANIPLLAEFRFVGRAHSIAALWWIVLIAFSIDVLWRAAADSLRSLPLFDSYDRVRLIRAMLLGVLAWGGIAIMDARNAIIDLDYIDTFIGKIDTYRFSYLSYREGTGTTLWLFVLGAVVIDTLLLVVEWRLRRGRLLAHYGVTVSAVGTRLIRLAVLVIVLAAIANLSQINSAVFGFGPRYADFAPLYEYARSREPDSPIPAINEPNTQNTAFNSYYYEVRQWGLNEGWIPNPLPNLIPSSELLDLPLWAIATDPGEPAVTRYRFRACTSRQPSPDGCLFYGEQAATLYQFPDALPYAFAAPIGTLLNTPETLSRSSAGRIPRPQHEQDTITIKARTPDDASQLYYLVVQETHFPGWRAFIDGLPVETASIGRFIGIPMAAGEHQYTLRYQPPGFAGGLVTFLVTLMVMGFYLRKSNE